MGLFAGSDGISATASCGNVNKLIVWAFAFALAFAFAWDSLGWSLAGFFFLCPGFRLAFFLVTILVAAEAGFSGIFSRVTLRSYTFWFLGRRLSRLIGIEPFWVL